MKYVALLRGINVGGKNKIPMTDLKSVFEDIGCKDVVTYIQTGNVVFSSSLQKGAIKKKIEETLPKRFELDNNIVKVLILTPEKIERIINNRPKGFGDQPNNYHSDVIFLMDINVNDALKTFSPREGVDTVWPGDGVVYSQRLSKFRTKSRLSKIMESPLYKSMTIRNWNTTRKLLELLQQD